MVILFASLLILMVSCLNIEKNEYVAPSFIFCASFVFSCAWATVYAKEWNLNLHFNTYWVVFGGVLEFTLVAYLTKLFLRKTNMRFRLSDHTVYKTVPIEINHFYSLMIIAIEVFTILFTLYEIRVATGISNIASALVYYNDITKFTEDSIVFPHAGLLYLLWDIVDATGFWITYILANTLIDKKFAKLPTAILVLSMLSSVFRGARTNAICKLMCFFCAYIILLRRSAEIKRKAIKTRFIVMIVMAAVIFIIGFKQFGVLMGRTITQTGTDYVAMYCGSEIKNLDTFLQENKKGIIDSFVDSQTFYVFLKWLKPKIGISGKTLAVLPQRYIKGITLGNVYTTFYQYIYDFGYVGLILLVALMSFLSQLSYEYAKSFREQWTVPISLVVYSYIFPSLVLSFFSNKFYERQFSTAFIKYCMIWYILNLLLVKIKIKFGVCGSAGRLKEKRL